MFIFYPSLLLISYFLYSKASQKKSNSFLNDGFLSHVLINLLNPTLILIDHGHFQYNCVSLGLMQIALFFILTSHDAKRPFAHLTIASVFFCLALNYKQMELYHALPFFFYLLAVSLNTKPKLNFFNAGFVFF